MRKTIREIYLGLTRNSDGSFSSTKFWQTIVYSVSTAIMIILTLRDKMEVEYFLVYLAIATGARSLQTYLINKSSNTQVAAVAQGADPDAVQQVSKPAT